MGGAALFVLKWKKKQNKTKKKVLYGKCGMGFWDTSKISDKKTITHDQKLENKNKRRKKRKEKKTGKE